MGQKYTTEMDGLIGGLVVHQAFCLCIMDFQVSSRRWLLASGKVSVMPAVTVVE